MQNNNNNKIPKALKRISQILLHLNNILNNHIYCLWKLILFFFFLIEVGSSLLRHPSPELSRLISAHSSLSKGERNFQWPVLAFVIQHHDLEGLEIAMKQALRKSACRVFAMEVQIHYWGYWFIAHTNHMMILFNDVTSTKQIATS